jgi:hypothetical protein
MDKKPPEIRVSLLIILAFGLVASKGIDFVDQARLSSATAAGPVPTASHPPGLESTGERLYARTDTATSVLTKPLTPAIVGPAGDAVTAALRVWPLAGVFWIRLAEVRAASGADLQSVLEAYRLSVLAAPFDGQMMLARQVLGVLLWDVLSTDDRRGAVRDLVDVWDTRPPALTDRLRAATEALSSDGRRTMRAALRLRAELQDRQLAAIGL